MAETIIKIELPIERAGIRSRQAGDACTREGEGVGEILQGRGQDWRKNGSGGSGGIQIGGAGSDAIANIRVAEADFTGGSWVVFYHYRCDISKTNEGLVIGTRNRDRERLLVAGTEVICHRVSDSNWHGFTYRQGLVSRIRRIKAPVTIGIDGEASNFAAYQRISSSRVKPINIGRCQDAVDDRASFCCGIC